jgi:hypothetical protein
MISDGAPRPMKIGTIVSPWRYDAGAFHALQLIILRLPAILRCAQSRNVFAMPDTDADTAYDPRRVSQKLHCIEPPGRWAVD